MTPIEKERTASLYDATSRVVIRAINWCKHPRGAQLGQAAYSADHGGLVSFDGTVALTDNAQCIRQIVYPQQEMFCYSTYPFPMYGVWGPIETMPQAFISAIPSITEKIAGITPQDMPLLLWNLTGQKDFVYLSRALKLDHVDYDQINSGAFIRVHADKTEPIPAGCIDLPIWDHLSFVRRNVLYQGVVFNVKYFRYVEQPEIYPFLFKPDQPDVWFPNHQDCWGNGRIMIFTDAQMVMAANTPFNALLIDAGRFTGLDWVLFCDRETCYAWDQNAYSNYARNELKTVIRFVEEAQKHEISVSVIVNTAAQTGQSFMPDKKLSWPEFIAQVDRFGLELPDSLRDEGFVYNCDTPNALHFDAPIWMEGGSALFYGSGCEIVERILLRYFNAVSSEPQITIRHKDGSEDFHFARKVGILCPSGKEAQRDSLIKEMRAKVYCIPGNLQEDELKAELHRNKIEIMLIICAGNCSPKKLVAALTLCKNMGIPISLFSDGENELEPEMTKRVSKRYYTVADGKSVIVKEMNSNRIERFKFTRNNIVFATPANETEIEKLMED